MLGTLVPSPRSEAVTNDLEELSLQTCPKLPPIKERKNVLQLRLQQRRTREQLVEQGIMPPLKSPAAFHEQIRSLERARTENFLKHKLCSRPERSELVRMHILQETLAEPSLQATQLKLKRARLADDLNEKLAQRPGPMELVVKNILPVDTTVKEAIDEGEADEPKPLDVYNFDEDSSDALSPEQPASQESQGSTASPRDARLPEPPAASPPTSASLQFCPPTSQCTSDFLSRASTEEQTSDRIRTTLQPIITAAPAKPAHALVKQSQPKPAGDKGRSKKSREPKPRVKKLKYHQYIPPDQKLEPNEAPMDSAYARLLQQQQQFLQLQILSQQQQQYNYQAILPAPLKPEGQSSCPNVALNSIMVSLPTAAPARQNHTLTHRKPGPLPANLDEMKVAELKMELKRRGLPVSGTKTDLIERLKPHQESHAAASAMEVTAPAGGLQNEGRNSTPPVSPAQSEVSGVGQEEAGAGDGPARGLCARSPSRPGTSPYKAPPEDFAMETKDQRLHEKERQIEELMRKLQHEQRLVEELKMQLQVEKRSQQPSPPIKEERGASPNCLAARSPRVKQEEPAAPAHTAPVHQFFISPQQVPRVLQQPQTLPSTQPGAQTLRSTQPGAQTLPSTQPGAQTLPSTQPGAQTLRSTQPGAQTLLNTQPGAQTLPSTQPGAQTLPSTQPGAQTLRSTQPGTQTLPSTQPGAQTLPSTQPGAQTLLNTQPGAQTLLPAIQLPRNSLTLQTQPVLQAAVSSPAPSLIPTSLLQPQKAEASAPQQHTNQTQPTAQTVPLCTTSSTGFQFRAGQNQAMPELPQCFLNSAPESRSPARASPSQPTPNGPNHKPPSPCPPTFILQPSTFTNHGPKSKDPPRYEEAVKQTRGLQAPVQVPTAISQHMDDLFDVLIESGEISPLIRQDPLSLDKLLPVTASVTTLPINTVLSRPPPQVQVARPPSQSHDAPPGLVSLATDNQLEAFLEGTLAGDAEPRTLRLMEELHGQMLEHPHSPMDTTELGFSVTPPPSFHLPDANLDNMEWLDLTMPGPAGISTPAGVFSSDFLDSHDLQLHWD